MTSLIPDHGLLRDWVDLYAPQGESPDEMHLAAALALLSAAVGWRSWIRWGEATEPVTLNVVLTGTSATARKTTTATTARRIAELATSQLGDTPPLRVRDITHTSDRGLLELVAPRDRSEADTWSREPPPGHLLIWDEIGSILGRPGDIKGDGWLGRTRSTLMQFTGGRHGGIQLGGDNKKPASRCAVSILGTMTRSELETRMSHGLINDGFIGRMVLIPYGARARYLPEPPEWTIHDTDRRERIVQRVKHIVTGEPYGEAFTHFTTDAHQLRRDWYVARTGELDDLAGGGDDVHVAIQAAHGRLQAIAVKLAVLSAIAAQPAGEAPTDLKVTATDVAWGIRFADHALQEIRSLAEVATETIGERYAAKVAAYLGGRNGGTTKKQVLDGIRMAGLTRPQRWSVVEQMHTEGTVEIRVSKTSGRERLTVRLTTSADNTDAADTNADKGKVAA